MKSIILLLAIATMICGCQSGGCIKVGGSYNGYDGNVEYCFDQAKTNAAGGVVLSETKDGETKEIFGMTGDEIEKIADDLLGAISKLDEGEQAPKPAIIRLRDYLQAKEGKK